jgi:hypothetical protein
MQQTDGALMSVRRPQVISVFDAPWGRQEN